jgi:hypothetical protein
MRFTNPTRFAANWTLGFQKDGRERLVVVVKATYDLPESGEEARVSLEQVPLVEADRHVAEPGLSAPLHETDFAHIKPGCDVLLIGSAWAPPGQRVKQLPVGLQVGTMSKAFQVVGQRHWRKHLAGVTASAPEPFERQSLTYDLAFGGTDTTRATEGATDTFQPNPVGRGYWRHHDHIDGQPLPNTEELQRPVRSPGGDYVPKAFSPVGRNWLPRRLWAGTYDEHWIRTTAPLWPDDFDERYFQAAPEDQVIPYPVGGENVVLRHLTPEGYRQFRLPRQPMPITYIPHHGRDLVRHANIDTVVLEPDLGRFTLTWRSVLPLGRSLFDVKETIIGERKAVPGAGRFTGKTHYRSLGDAVRARRGAR